MRLPPGRFQRTIRNSLTSVEPSHLGFALRRRGERTQNALDRFTKRTPRYVFRLDHHSYSLACSCGEERQAAWQYAHTCLLPRLASKPETRGTRHSWGNAHSTQYSGTRTRYSYATQGRNSATLGISERYSLTPSVRIRESHTHNACWVNSIQRKLWITQTLTRFSRIRRALDAGEHWKGSWISMSASFRCCSLCVPNSPTIAPPLCHR